MADNDRRGSIDSLTDALRQITLRDGYADLDRDLAGGHGPYTREVLNLPARDRNAIAEEIHGVTTLCPPEGEGVLEDALRRLASELAAVPEDSPLVATYRESQVLPETYVNTDDFRLRFLRCELLDAKKAALRMLNWLDLAVLRFGPEVLKRPPRISDFTKDELGFMRRGCYQYLPFRDRAGRPIYAWVGDFSMQTDSHLRQKTNLYYHYVMSGDVENQRKGMVKLHFMLQQPRAGDASSDPKPVLAGSKFRNFIDQSNRQFFDGIPLRTVAYHWCLPDQPHYRLFHYSYGLMNRKAQDRTRFHHGQPIEVLYNLKAYGIPVDLIPIREDGAIRTKFWKQWISARKKLEQVNNKPNGNSNVPPQPSSMVLYPGSSDVLFRKGDSLTSHPGNSALRNYIEDRMPAHSRASNTEKESITSSIVDAVREQDGRFLEWNKKGWWTELDPALAHTKVANQVRLSKFRPQQLQPPQTVRSSTQAFANQDHARVKRRKISRDGFASDSSEEEGGGCDCACLF